MCVRHEMVEKLHMHLRLDSEISLLRFYSKNYSDKQFEYTHIHTKLLIVVYFFIGTHQICLCIHRYIVIFRIKHITGHIWKITLKMVHKEKGSGIYFASLVQTVSQDNQGVEEGKFLFI